MRVGLVGCVKTKQRGTHTARELYTSPLFVGRRSYVERTCDRWFILSAKHGVLDPDDRLESYDETLNGAPDATKRAWSERVLEQLRQKLGAVESHDYELHAGRDYWDFGLRRDLEAAGARVDYPVQGLGQGEQRAFYDRARRGDPEIPADPHRDGSDGPVLIADHERAREAAKRLLEAWRGPGIFDHREMPESELPSGMRRGSDDHARFITLTVAIDYMRDASDLWRAARATYEDAETRWVFNTGEVQRRMSELGDALGRHGVTRRPQDDPATWSGVATGLQELADGDPTQLAASCEMDAPTLLDEIRRPEHRRRFPRLRGRKIGPLWIRMLADECGVPLKRLDEIPIPVDVHIARTTFACGALHGSAHAGVEELADAIADVWREACRGLDAYPLQLDQALWLQSRDGCSTRRGDTCPRESECAISDLCVGGQIAISDGVVQVMTSVDGSLEQPTPTGPPTSPGSATVAEGEVWDRVVALEGAVFRTKRGLPFRYRRDGTNIVVEERQGASIPRAHIELAWSERPLHSVSDVPESCWGRSYIYGILADDRIAPPKDRLW